jgi:hypothetical protein
MIKNRWVPSLEQELRTRLFERHARGVTLTAAGLRLLPRWVRRQCAAGVHARCPKWGNRNDAGGSAVNAELMGFATMA